MNDVCRVCGCRNEVPCPGGCYWVEDDLCSSCANVRVGPGATPELLVEAVEVTADLGMLLALHGSLCLALQAPALTTRLPRALLEPFLALLGELLVEYEVLTPELRDEARRAVLAAGPRIVLARG